MDKAPADYQIAISTEQVRQAGNYTFDIDELEKAMTQLYCLKTTKKVKGTKIDKNGEIALAGVTCYSCNKKGHISRNCPDKNSGHGGRGGSNGGRGGRGGRGGTGGRGNNGGNPGHGGESGNFLGNCFHCGVRGH
jgi:hypothetical protein